VSELAQSRSQLPPSGRAEGKVKMRTLVKEELAIPWGFGREPLLLVTEHRIVPREAAKREHIFSSPVEIHNSDLSLPTDVFYRG
jgi:hypothetical protein